MTTDETQTAAADGSVEQSVRPIAYLYHDARVPEDAHPWLHSTMLVLAANRRPGLRGETPLVTLAQAEAMVTVERERYAPLMQAVEQLLDAGHMNQEHLARLRAAWEAA